MPESERSNPNPTSAKIQIVLASASPRRISLVKNLGLDFEILPSDIDEIVRPGLSPAEVVAELAESKASRVQELIRERGGTIAQGDYVIIAADTIVVFEDDILGKPADREDAIAMLTRLVGNRHQVFTGVHILDVSAINLDKSEIRRYHDVEVASVEFRPLSLVEISNYVDTKEPMDKAGAYALQGIGAFMIEKIEGSPSNIIGLPLVLTTRMLRQCGIKIMGE